MLGLTGRGCAAIFALAVLAACAGAPQPHPQAAFVIAAPAEGAPVFAADDEFMAVVTPADISIRTRLAEADLEALKRTYAGAFEEWTAEERTRLEAMLARRQSQLAALSEWLPPSVLILKSNGAADTQLPHTRGAAINMGRQLPESDQGLDALFFHELFHVLSRHNASRHDEMYALINFVPCAADLPPDLTAATVTNPDAPHARWAAPLDDSGRFVVARLFADPPRWDPAQPVFARYFNLRFLEASNAGGQCAVTLVDGAPVEVSQEDAVAAFHRAAGANTNYVLHPEELLADNFSQLMTGRSDVANPEVHQRLAGFLGIAVAPAQAGAAAD